MICEDELPSAVHDLPEAERATFQPVWETP
jgi:hypothetical protein